MRLTLLLILILCAAPAAARDRNIRGLVTDESNAVLPGVTVVAAGEDGRVLATVVTDATGHYTLGPIAAGRVIVTFQLEGFAPVSVRATVSVGVDTVADQRLKIGSRSETVEVVGRMPVPPGPPPKPAVRPVPDHDRDAVCGPARIEGPPQADGTIRSRRFAANGVYGAGDELVIDGGTANGLEPGTDYVVRRTYRVEWEPREEVGEHTAGLVQIVAAGERTAEAVVIYACDEMLPGDRLVPFAAPARRAPEDEGKPDFRNPARILFPDVGQLLGAPGRMLVIDRGSLLGVHAGQRVTLFRRSRTSRSPTLVGDGVVVAVRSDSATIRVNHTSGAIFPGDLAAFQR